MNRPVFDRQHATRNYIFHVFHRLRWRIGCIDNEVYNPAANGNVTLWSLIAPLWL
jgi:hypothetical protein